MTHPHWDSILAHLGKELDEAVQQHEWCQQSGITTGARYLLYWAASLFKKPEQKLPYLFFYGPQEAGKSSFNNGLGLLMSRGHVEARNSLLSSYNGELDGAMLAYIEEVDLRDKVKDAYNRIKDWSVADYISINAKYVNVYKSPSYVHWIQVANERKYCPIFEDDTRIVVIQVPNKPAQDIPWPTLREILKAEAPDFLRTLFDLPLPEVGVGRLWLPVLDTEAKQQAITESKDYDQTHKEFDPKALETKLRHLIFKGLPIACKSLVVELLKQIGQGPWSQDPNVFGRQLKTALKNAHERGLKASSQRTSEGVEWTIGEDWNDNNIDPLQEWAQMSLLADYAMSILRPTDDLSSVVPIPKQSSVLKQTVVPSGVTMSRT